MSTPPPFDFKNGDCLCGIAEFVRRVKSLLLNLLRSANGIPDGSVQRCLGEIQDVNPFRITSSFRSSVRAVGEPAVTAMRTSMEDGMMG